MSASIMACPTLHLTPAVSSSTTAKPYPARPFPSGPGLARSSLRCNASAASNSRLSSAPYSSVARESSNSAPPAFNSQPITAPCSGIRLSRRQPFRAGPLHAKKGGGGVKKGGKGGKTSALANLLKEKEAAQDEEQVAGPATPEQHSSPEMLMYLMVLTQGYWQQAKEYLLDGADFSQLGAQVFGAPFGVVAQDKFSEPQAVAYANHAMLDLLEGNWDEVVGVKTDQFCANKEGREQDMFFSESTPSTSKPYQGHFVSLQGKKFTVLGGILFDINGPDGTKIGQGLKFAEVVFEDGTVRYLDPVMQAEHEAKGALPKTVQEAEEWVKQQGDFVRSLKSDKGLTNQDEEVVTAVEELLQRKQHLERLVSTASASADGAAA